jgi:hypothetical protein
MSEYETLKAKHEAEIAALKEEIAVLKEELTALKKASSPSCVVSEMPTKYPELDSVTDEDTVCHRAIVIRIAQRIQEKLDNTPDCWSSLETKKGATQKAEARTKQLVQEQLIHMNYSYTEASSQQPYDFRDVGKNSGVNSLWLEIKKTDSATVTLNDTLPHPRSWYLFFSTRWRKIIVLSGAEMLKLGKRNESDTFHYADIQEYYLKVMFERLYSKRCGAFRVCMRPNFSFDISVIMKNKHITLKPKPKSIDLRRPTPPSVSAHLEEPNGMCSFVAN